MTVLTLRGLLPGKKGGLAVFLAVFMVLLVAERGKKIE